MSTRRIIFGLIVCFLIAVFVGQTLSQTRGRTRTSKTTDRNRLSVQRLREQQRMAEQRRRLNEERVAKQMMDFKQRAKDRHDGRNERRNQFLKQTLEATEEQWKVIEPKINRIYFFRNQSSISMGFGGVGVGYSGGSSGSRYRTGSSSGGGSGGGYRTGVSSGGGSGGYVMRGGSGSGSGGSAQFWAGPTWRLVDRPLTEGEKACEELSELLQNKNSDPEKIRQKMVALRQAREKARNQLAKVRQELREILNSRQEAKLVLLEVLD
ncbi:hypothetical protein ES703_56652 [subsurface metagenome]